MQRRIENTELVAFRNIGIDMAGPFETKNRPGKPRNKRYMIIFSCYYTRAVNLLKVDNADTYDLYCAFVRHVAQHGAPNTINTDNGKNLMGLKRTFEEMRENWEENSPLIKEDLESIEWTTNPPFAPWWGAHFESLIKTAKRTMKQIIRWPKYLLSDTELETVFAQVTALMNIRPLGPSSSDLRDNATIRPTDFLNTGKGVPGVMPYLENLEPNYQLIKRTVDKATAEIWKRMLQEIVVHFNRMNKKLKETKPYEIGDVVVCGEVIAPNYKWPLGLVTQVFPGSDGKVRQVELRSGGKLRIRDVKTLARLNLQPAPEERRFF